MVCAYVLLRRYMERVVLVPENLGGLKYGGSNTLQILVTLMFHVSTYDSEQASSFIRLLGACCSSLSRCPAGVLSRAFFYYFSSPRIIVQSHSLLPILVEQRQEE